MQSEQKTQTRHKEHSRGLRARSISSVSTIQISAPCLCPSSDRSLFLLLWAKMVLSRSLGGILLGPFSGGGVQGWDSLSSMNHDSQLMVEPLLKRHLISPLGCPLRLLLAAVFQLWVSWLLSDLIRVHEPLIHVTWGGRLKPKTLTSLWQWFNYPTRIDNMSRIPSLM